MRAIIFTQSNMCLQYFGMLCCNDALPAVQPFEHSEDSMPNARIIRGLCNPESIQETGHIARAGQQGYCHCAIRAEKASAAVAVKLAEGAQAGGHPQGRACHFGPLFECMGYSCPHKECSICRCGHVLGLYLAISALLHCLKQCRPDCISLPLPASSQCAVLAGNREPVRGATTAA